MHGLLLTSLEQSVAQQSTHCPSCKICSRVEQISRLLIESLPTDNPAAHWVATVHLKESEDLRVRQAFSSTFTCGDYVLSADPVTTVYGDYCPGELTLWIKKRRCSVSRQQALAEFDQALQELAQLPCGDHTFTAKYQAQIDSLCKQVACPIKGTGFKLRIDHREEFENLAKRAEKLLTKMLDERGVAYRLSARRGKVSIHKLPPEHERWERFKLVIAGYSLAPACQEQELLTIN